MIVSALRAYYTTTIGFDDFTDSRSQLDVLTAVEPATSIIVASSLVLGPLLKRMFGSTSSRSKSNKTHSFQRIEEDHTNFPRRGVEYVELGETKTAVHGPSTTEPSIDREIMDIGEAWIGDPIEAPSNRIAVKNQVWIQRDL